MPRIYRSTEQKKDLGRCRKGLQKKDCLFISWKTFEDEINPTDPDCTLLGALVKSVQVSGKFKAISVELVQKVEEDDTVINYIYVEKAPEVLLPMEERIAKEKMNTQWGCFIKALFDIIPDPDINIVGNL